MSIDRVFEDPISESHVVDIGYERLPRFSHRRFSEALNSPFLFTNTTKWVCAACSLFWHSLDWFYLYYFGSDLDTFHWFNCISLSDSIIQCITLFIFMSWIVITWGQPLDYFPSNHVMSQLTFAILVIMRILWGIGFIVMDTTELVMSEDISNSTSIIHQESMNSDLIDIGFRSKEQAFDTYFIGYASLSFISTIIWSTAAAHFLEFFWCCVNDS